MFRGNHHHTTLTLFFTVFAMAGIPMGVAVPETVYTRVVDNDDECGGICDNPAGAACLKCIFCLGEEGRSTPRKFKRTCAIVSGSVCGFFTIFVFLTCHFISSNTRCHPEQLEGQRVPFGGALLPDHLWLEPRYTWFSFSQQMDVWAANQPSLSLGARIGHFYDVRIPFVFFSLAYQDDEGRVWFHAKTPGLFSRISWMPGAEYELERCDAAPPNATGPASFRLRQSFWEGDWFCTHGCRRVYHLMSSSADESAHQHVARVVFDSALSWVYGKTRHQWSMTVTPLDNHEKKLASAQSHVFPAQSANRQAFPLRLLSRWNVDVEAGVELDPAADISVPNWAAAVLAALEEMEGEDEESDVA